MNILGISGSPNINGNTSYAVKYALDLLNDDICKTKYISLSERTIAACDGCWKCQINNNCKHNDDMEEIYETLRWCDGLIIGSPVYFGMVTGQLKTMMDRTVVFRPSYNKPFELAGKTGCGIACGGFRNGGQELTLQNIHSYLLQQNMKVINDGSNFSHSGGTIVGIAKEDTLGLKTIANLVTNLKSMI